MRGLAIVAGVVVVLGVMADAINTLITTRIQSSKWWPTDVMYRLSWRAWRRVALWIRSEPRREAYLSLYGPLSLFGLLVMWIVLSIAGWGLVWWGLPSQIAGVGGLFEAIYFSGVVFFTVGFGEIVPVDGVPRVLSLVEAFAGLSTIALMIGYLPTLYSSYSARETQLLTLDDLEDERITPVTLVRSYIQDGDLSRLGPFFREWELWTARVLESHTSYPMLTTFRSQHPGQSWITALGVVLDAASLVLVGFEDGPEREAERMYRRGARAVIVLSARLGFSPAPVPAITEEMRRSGYEQLEQIGVAVRPYDELWSELNRVRGTYHPQLEGLIDGLLTPRGFWSAGVAPGVDGSEVSAVE